MDKFLDTFCPDTLWRLYSEIIHGYVKKFWHAYCKWYLLRLCKEVLARLLQGLKLIMIIKIIKCYWEWESKSKRYWKWTSLSKTSELDKVIMIINIKNIWTKQNENHYQQGPLYYKRVLIMVLKKMTSVEPHSRTRVMCKSEG